MNSLIVLVFVVGTLLNGINACTDTSLYCKHFKDTGQCITWPDYVHKVCAKTCGVCTGNTPPPPVTTRPTATPRPPVTQGPRPPTGSCGHRPYTRIVGGTQASPGSWPWQAMLRRSSGSSFCGGTLVAPQWVVTAAHCVERKGVPTPVNHISVRMGAHKKSGKDKHAQDFGIEKIIIHESYKKPLGLSHDIALVKLDKPARLDNYVNLACLSDSTTPQLPIDDMTKKCWVTGWGRLQSGGASPTVLMQVSVPLVSKARCLRSYPNLIHDSMVCAGVDQGGIDACQGDSGGPLVCKFGGRWYHEGVVSWGIGCGDKGKFGVYAKMRYLLPWVHQKMAAN